LTAQVVLPTPPFIWMREMTWALCIIERR